MRILLTTYADTNAELPIRLAFFWTTMYIADIFSAFIAIPIFKLDGVNGHEGWRVRPVPLMPPFIGELKARAVAVPP